jgi:4-amino-4-deoxy-L-arabinose transferase-like glycosyltransferase
MGDPPADRVGPLEHPEARRRPAIRLDIPIAVAVGLVVALGLFLRLWILGRAPVNSDQAVVGLMAHEILRGHLFTFYWGQNYGGGEPYLVAALFALLGQSRFVLGLTPILLDAIAALLLWRIGRRLFEPRAALLAALIFWVWPEVYLFLSTVEYGFRFLTLVCGLATLLFALRLGRDRSARLVDWAALGLFAGLGWWCSPEIIYYALPALLWLGYRLACRRARLRLGGVVLTVAMALGGALPWLFANVGHGYPSLRTQVLHSYGTTWAGRLGTFFGDVAPLVFGVRLRSSGDWLAGPIVGTTLYVLLVCLVLVWAVRLALKRRAGLLVVFAALFPFIYAYSPSSWYWQDGRYALYLSPVLALLAASALCELPRGPSRLARFAPALGLIVALVLTLSAAARLAPYVPIAGSSGARSAWTSWRSDPDQWLQPLIVALDRSHVGHVYAGYWVAYALTFETAGRIVATDPGVDRYPPYLAAVERSDRQAWVFPRPSTLPALDAAVGAHPWLPSLTLAQLERDLNRRGLVYRTANAGYFTIVWTDHAAGIHLSSMRKTPPVTASAWTERGR